MSWRSVIITQHSKLSYSSNLMVVQNRDGVEQIPVDDIQLLVVATPHAVVTSGLISALAQQNSKVIFVDKRYFPVCETNSYFPNNRDRSHLTTQFNWDPDRQAQLWTKIVEAKLKNQLQVLQVYDHETTELEAELDALQFNDLSNREAVVARKYFPLLFEDERFSRRSGEAVNAALDYGYAIVLSMVTRSITEAGYLPQLGIHHHNNENQYNLASDLMEPFRPMVDYWVANQNFIELTPDVKYGLVDALNLVMKYQGKEMLLRNVIGAYVGQCLHFLSADNEDDDFEIEMGVLNEVPNNALASHV